MRYFLISKIVFLVSIKWFFDIRNSISWYHPFSDLSIKCRTFKNHFWYPKLDFLISENDSLTSDIQSDFYIINCWYQKFFFRYQKIEFRTDQKIIKPIWWYQELFFDMKKNIFWIIDIKNLFFDIIKYMFKNIKKNGTLYFTFSPSQVKYWLYT